jgi:hypothetical protein
MYSHTTGGDNDAFGAQALYSLTTANLNVALGRNAMYGTTTGTSNLAAGTNAMYTNSTGSYNTALGKDALRSNTTASNNTAVGYQAGYSNTTGDVTAFGRLAMRDNTTGVGSTAMGLNALLVNTTGGNNTALGYAALSANTTASNNTAVGYQAGYAATTGGYNTFIGFQSGLASNFTSDAFANNTFVGALSGSTVTTGRKNTILGLYNGNQFGLDIRTSDNNVVLSDGDGKPVLVIPTGTNRPLVAGGGLVAPADSASYYSTIGAIGADIQLLLYRTTDAGAGWGGIGASSTYSFNNYNQNLGARNFSIKQTDGTVILKGATDAATGTGITFPATQNASSNANTLDDYEEGTWTPTNAGDATGTIGFAVGEYVKVGRMVYIRGVVDINSNFTNNSLGGLPFTPSGNTAATSIGAVNIVMNGAGANLAMAVNIDTARLVFYTDNNVNNFGGLTTTNDVLRFSITYQTAS